MSSGEWERLLIPKPLPDETPFSHMERIATINCAPPLLGLKRLMRRHSDLRGLRLSGNLCSVLAELSGMSEDEYFANHSLNAVYRFALGAANKPQDERRLFNISRNDLYALRAIGRDVMHCFECDRISRREYGFAYLSRLHYIPGVEVCPLHEVPLSRQLHQPVQGWRVDYQNARRARPSRVIVEANGDPAVIRYRESVVSVIRGNIKPNCAVLLCSIRLSMEQMRIRQSMERRPQVADFLARHYPATWLNRLAIGSGTGSSFDVWHLMNIRGYYSLILMSVL